MRLLCAGANDDLHLEIDADADLPLGDVPAALEEVSPGPYWLDGKLLSGTVRLADSGLRDGALVYAGPEMVLGRDPAASLVLPDEAVSWHHARLFPTDSGWTVEDLGSTNGTWVGATRVEARPV